MNARRLALCVLPPLGAALAATAAIDFAGYTRFVRSIAGFGWRAPSLENAVVSSVDLLPGGLLGVGLLCFALTRFQSSRGLAGAGWLALLAGLAAPLWVAHEAREVSLHMALVAACIDGVRWSDWAQREDLALLAFGGTLLVAMLLCVRKARTGEWLIAAVTGAAVMALSIALSWPFGTSEGLTGEAIDQVANAALDSAAGVHIWEVRVVWMLAAGVALHRVRARRQIQTRGAAVACCLGAVAFGATRDLAHDASNVLPIVNDEASLYRDAVVPIVKQCDPSPTFVSALMFFQGEGHISGASVGRIGQPGGREAIAKKMEEWRQQYFDLRSYMVEPTPPYDPEISIHAEPDRPMADLIPFLLGLQDASVQKLQLESVRTFEVDSKTRGHLERHPRCVRHFTLASDGVPVSRFRTWGELAQALDRGEVRLALP